MNLNYLKTKKYFFYRMDISVLFEKLEEILQASYFGLNPYNPNNSEDKYQELFRHNIREELNLRVDSEYTYQKDAFDINNEEISLKNKTDRYDLLIKKLSVLFELKSVEKLDSLHDQQLFHYLDTSEYKYGILINFAKSKDLQKSFVHCKIYGKKDKITKKDKFNREYSHYKYELINELQTQSYYELMGDNIIQGNDDSNFSSNDSDSDSNDSNNLQSDKVTKVIEIS